MRQRHVGLLALGCVTTWACGDDAVSMIGDAMVDAGEMLDGAGRVLDGAADDGAMAQPPIVLACDQAYTREMVYTGGSTIRQTQYFAEGAASVDLSGSPNVRGFVCDREVSGSDPFLPACTTGPGIDSCTGDPRPPPLRCQPALPEFDADRVRVFCGHLTESVAADGTRTVTGYRWNTVRVLVD